MATIEIGGPFKVLAQQLWIKAENRKPPALGEAILPTAVEASSSDTGSPAVNLINGKGLRSVSRDGLNEHTSDASSMWRSAKGQAKGWVQFDFDKPQKLDAILVWNYNETWHTDQGVRQMDISAWTPESGWRKIRENQSLEPGEGGNSYDEPTLVRLETTTAQKVRFDGFTSLGASDYIGLSKVQFFGPRGPQAARLFPDDGAEGVGVNDLELTWTAGGGARTHNVYFGTRPDDLQPLAKVEQAVVKVSSLKCNARYYWRVDEVQADGSVAGGKVCTFTTGGLAAWWKLDEGSGDVVGDSSGYGHRGELHGGPQWVTESSGRALSFDGIDDYIDCGSDSRLMQVGSVSVGAWIKLGALGKDAKIASNQDAGSGYKLGVYTNNQVEFEIRVTPNAVPTTNRFVSGGTTLQQGVWCHVVGVYEKGSYLRTYVNGQLDREQQTPELAAISRGPLVIGRESFAPTTAKTYWWRGALHDVCVFTYALNAGEVKALYSGTAPTAVAPASAALPALVSQR